MQHENFTDESLQLEDIEARNRMDYFTDFVDDIDDVNFDDFFGGRKKRQERLENRLDRRSDRKEKRGERKGRRNDARDLRRATKAGMTLEEYRASRNDADTDENTQLENQRGKLDLSSLGKPFQKRPAKAQVKEEVNQENDEIINGEVPIDSPLATSSIGGSFFEENKQMIMIGGGILLAGIVYFKFIKK